MDEKKANYTVDQLIDYMTVIGTVASHSPCGLAVIDKNILAATIKYLKTLQGQPA